ncbi:MAG: putative signal peptide peptidase SppA [Alphaproteobacteria bacterium MarineAlpha11_Bin1]|nr:MAG: putative signal peptide peptidase SppA [Alphaproteobacteria bacterium MarineAlpha11_Bin1]|tara:strand:- start:8064 stop:8930 length:867 start_codon:yes stop_codon:yes gene_type:complete
MNLDSIKDAIGDLLRKLPFERFRNPPPVIGVLRLDGVIGRSAGPGRTGLSLESHERAITKLFARRNLRAVALVINSPGGSPVQSALIARQIRDLAEEKQISVISFCEDVAASGGYWLACAGDEIFADSNSIIGSIGVISAGFGFADLIERFGIERRVYSTGKRKGMLDPFQDEKSEDVDRLRELQEDIFENFKSYIYGRRGDRLKASDGVLFSGDVWTGNQAVENGLIDGLAEMRSEMRDRFGDRVIFCRASVRPGLISRLRGGASSIDSGDLISAIDDWALWKRYRI